MPSPRAVRHPGPRWSVGLVLLLVALSHTPAQAQEAPDSVNAPRWWVGFDLIAADPLGPFGERVGDAWGFQLRGRYAPNPLGHLSVRLDLGLVGYGEEYRQFCLPAPVGCRIGAELGTSNDILYLGLGPEYSVWHGRIYGFGTVGVSVFSTTSTLSGVSSAEALLATTNHEDAVLAVRVGAGVRIPLTRGMRRITLDLDAAYHHNGVAEYLAEGDIRDNPDGSVTIFPNRTEANVLALQLGVSFGVGRGVVTAR